MSVQIGPVTIERKYVRYVLTAIGGSVRILAAALDDEGETIEKKLSGIKKDEVYQLISMEVSGIVKVKAINVDKKIESGKTVYIFNIALQLIA